MDFWEEYDKIRCNLSRLIKRELRKINWERLPEEEVSGKFTMVYEKLLRYWQTYIQKLKLSSPSEWDKNGKKIKKPLAINNLKRALYEALFYYAFLRATIAERGLKILREDENNIRFEILPISGPIALIFYYKGKRYAPQIDADFFDSIYLRIKDGARI